MLAERSIVSHVIAPNGKKVDVHPPISHVPDGFSTLAVNGSTEVEFVQLIPFKILKEKVMSLCSNRPPFPIRTKYFVCGLGNGRFGKIGIIVS